jgi:hypothetical protein
LLSLNTRGCDARWLLDAKTHGGRSWAREALPKIPSDTVLKVCAEMVLCQAKPVIILLIRFLFNDAGETYVGVGDIDWGDLLERSFETRPIHKAETPF